MVPLARCREAMAAEQVLAGNINPVATLRNGTPDKIVEALRTCHREAGTRYIVAAGCEVPRDTAEANVVAMRDFAQGLFDM